MVPRLEQTLDNDIESFSDIFGKDYIFAVLSVKQLAEQLTGSKNLCRYRVCPCSRTTVDVIALLAQILINGFCYADRLREAGAGIVSVNAHSSPRS